MALEIERRFLVADPSIPEGRPGTTIARGHHPVADAEAMLAGLCGAARIRRVRQAIEHAGRVREVDRFEAENAPLVLAEIELESEDAEFARPPRVGTEVTEDRRLLDTNRCRYPLAAWSADERRRLLSRETSC